jgi:ATP:corrinoid adenosyltransferase
MIDEINTVRPDAFDIDTLTGQHTLVLGAPFTGKSHLVRKSNLAHARVTRLDAALESRDDEFIILDEFYTAYQEADNARQRKFESWLDRKASVCVVARPRDIDWLLRSDGTALSTAFIDAFDEVCYLRYRPDDETDRDRAVECCLSILRDHAKQVPDRDSVKEQLDTLCKTARYDYEDPALQELLDEYGETLVPALVVYFSDQLADGGDAILPDGVNKACGDILQDTSFSTFFEATKWASSKLFSRETLSKLGSIVSDAANDTQDTGEGLVTAASTLGVGGLGATLGPAGLAAGGSLALYLYLREDDEQTVTREVVFDVLLSDRLTPIARVELEAELDLPPRTIRNFRRLVDGGTIEQLLRHRERLDEELGDVEDRLDEIEIAAEQYEEDLQRMSEMLATLDETTIDHTDLASYVATSIAEATADVDDFRDTVHAEEENVLQIGSVDRIPPYLGDENERIFESVVENDTDLIILRGSHGTGKTTAGYRACRTLANIGYDVALPNFERSSLEAIEYSLTSSASETVVFASFRRGTIETTRSGTPGNSGNCSRGWKKDTVQQLFWSAGVKSIER